MIKYKIYCSGPLFCPEEVAGMSSIAVTLENEGFDVFLPHRDGIERFVMDMVNSSLNINILGIRDIIDRAIFALDVYQIVEGCDCLVLNMNGRVPDEGAVAESGIAFAAGKPVVLYKNDFRSIFKGRDNSMITGLSEFPAVNKLDQLPEIVMKAVSSCQNSPSVSSQLEKTVNYGKNIWSVLKHFPKGKLTSKDKNNLVEEIILLS